MNMVPLSVSPGVCSARDLPCPCLIARQGDNGALKGCRIRAIVFVEAKFLPGLDSLDILQPGQVSYAMYHLFLIQSNLS